MKVAITGGTGFVGRHLARELVAQGHGVVLVARGVDHSDPAVRSLPGVTPVAAAVDDASALGAAFAGCEAVAHLAGINLERGTQTYRRVHVEGTRAVAAAARRAGVRKLVLLSFLRARPGCGSPYHESKWAAEEIVRESGLDFTVLKAGAIYGRGDQLLHHLSQSLHTSRWVALVRGRDMRVAAVAVEDLVRIALQALVAARLSQATVAVVGPEALGFDELTARVAQVTAQPVRFVRLPIALHRLLARLAEATMRVPLVTRAQVQMLAEGIVEPAPGCAALPPDLAPRTRFGAASIRAGLPPAGGIGWRDLRIGRAA